ncbi:hypothetical protein V5N11_024445 [Cardamine amara subsp. amara]|uniref:Non-haem dioxygenase N-terminal domain-containing protein n=1 Tax=Cardamine amara subsp. amara TaxID=228776 RepID=A0ABD0Z277_CARAN
MKKAILLLILKTKKVKEMENKTQEEDSTIKVSSIHCIDLSNSDIHQSALLLKQACQDCGFFYVINHGYN